MATDQTSLAVEFKRQVLDLLTLDDILDKKAMGFIVVSVLKPVPSELSRAIEEGSAFLGTNLSLEIETLVCGATARTYLTALPKFKPSINSPGLYPARGMFTLLGSIGARPVLCDSDHMMDPCIFYIFNRESAVRMELIDAPAHIDRVMPEESCLNVNDIDIDDIEDYPELDEI